MRWKSLIPVAVVSAALGCAAAVGLVAALGLGGGHTTTVVQQAPLRGDDTAGASSAGLTPRDIYKRAGPGVVFIRAQVVEQSQSPFDFGFPQEQRGEATGSGFVIDRDGTILTNAHVVSGATRVTVQFADKHVVDARILGRDESTDLAVLKVSATPSELQPLSLGSSGGVQVGDPTIAIGNPFGLERTLTTGVVSATRRTIQAPNGLQINGVIQTDAAINPGNSGGPLLDATGRVIGINSQIATGGSGGGNVGIGFAIPIDTAKHLLPQLEKTGKGDRGFLGIEEPLTIDPSLSDLTPPVDRGVLVQTVTPGSPADRAGVKGGDIVARVDGNDVRLGGDIIIAVNGKKESTGDELVNKIAAKQQGDKVKLDLLHDGQQRTVEVTLAARPTQTAGGG